MKELETRLSELEARKAELVNTAMESQSADEVRSINSQLEELNKELEEVREAIAKFDVVPEDAQKVNGQAKDIALGTTQKRSETMLESIEYRNAFRDYIIKGTPIPAEFRNGDVSSTANMGAAIPMTIVNEVINTVRKRYGNLYSKVRKISVKGGVAFPVGALSATFKWITEATVSPRQKLGDLGRVQFGYHTLEIRLAQTFEAYVLGLSAFEAEFARAIAIAYLQAMDEGIVNGSGNGCMTGILNDPRVTNTVTMTAAKMGNWTEWRKNFFAKLPLGYRSGEFIFPMSTVETYLETMADSNNNPIFRQAAGLEVNDGDAVYPNGRFFGREISLVEEDILPDFDTAQQGDVIGIYWQPEEYAINENFGLTVRRYFDEETNEYVDKALAIVDGKVLNPTGYVKILKG